MPDMKVLWVKPIGLIGCSLLLGSVIAAQVQEGTRPTVLRARRPTFERKDWDGIFFENLFAEALSGERPKSLGTPKVSPPGPAPAALTESNSGADRAGWSALVERTVLENEAKRLQILLNQQVTTPAKFGTEHNQARQTFSLLSMIFGIISQYDKEVRWKDHAQSAQHSMARAASNSRTGSQQSYAFAKRSKEDLTELVRGGSFPDQPDADPIKNWADVIDRTPIMQRLEFSLQERLKEPTSSENAFRADADLVLHEANLIAAMGRILASPEMLDADDDSYVELAEKMESAAVSMSAAVRANDYPGVSAALDSIGQSCVACHGEWR